MTDPTPANIRHETDHLVITCSDHRFQSTISDKLSELDITSFDRIAYPGASKAVVDGAITKPILTLKRLHNFQNIHVIDHTDCGGFGGLEAFNFDESEEAETHFRSLKKAAKIINTLLPNVVVVEKVIGL